jgi:hypothetical protein
MTFSGVNTDAVWLPAPEEPPTPPTPEDSTEIIAPYWENTGTWIDLTALTDTTFADQFGVAVDGANFEAVFALEKSALVNTTDTGNRLQIQDTVDCTNAGLYICDANGSVVDSMIYAGVPNGDSVLVPSNATNYYVVTSSDTELARIKKWGVVPVSTTGSVSWESVFNGASFGDDNDQRIRLQIPAGGIAIRFTVPSANNVGGIFNGLEIFADGRPVDMAINQTVHDLTTPPTAAVGGPSGSYITYGIDQPGRDIALTVGQTYFWNLAKRDGASGELYINYTWAQS